MRPRFILGIDGGGSKTECAIRELGGTAGFVARAGASNHEGIGFEKAGANLREAVTGALSQAGAAPADIAAACFAMAGVDIPQDKDMVFRAMVEPLGLSCPLTICNDAFAGFRAGSKLGVGLCVSLGSGVTYCGANSAGGVLQMEYPRPLAIDGRIQNLLMSEHFGIGPACSFTAPYLAFLGLKSLDEYFLAQYAKQRSFLKGVDFALVREARRFVFCPATFSDPVTCRMLQQYGHELAEILCGIGTKLNLGNSAFDLVLSGSLITKGRHPALNDTIIADVTRMFPAARPVVVDGLPVEGALLMAEALADK